MVDRCRRVHRRLAIPLALALLALLALVVPALPPTGTVRADDTVTVTDVVVFNVDSYDKVQEPGLFEQFAEAGVPAVVTDFRAQPLENTVPSVRPLAKPMGQEERASTFVDHYTRQLDAVSSRRERVAEPRPTTFLNRAAASSTAWNPRVAAPGSGLQTVGPASRYGSMRRGGLR